MRRINGTMLWQKKLQMCDRAQELLKMQRALSIHPLSAGFQLIALDDLNAHLGTVVATVRI
eukprot:scaffold82603_cov22-Prasinocladus_malaysianus.AAC.1